MIYLHVAILVPTPLFISLMGPTHSINTHFIFAWWRHVMVRFPRHRPLWGKFTNHRWIPATKGQWCGVLMVFVLITNNWWTNSRVIRDLRRNGALVMFHCIKYWFIRWGLNIPAQTTNHQVYCIVLWLHCIVIVLYCIVLHCFVLYCIVYGLS